MHLTLPETGGAAVPFRNSVRKQVSLSTNFALIAMNLLVIVCVFMVGFLFCTSHASKQGAVSTKQCDSGEECVPFTECSQLFKSQQKNETVQICGIDRQISYVCCGRDVNEPSSDSVVALSWSESSQKSQKDDIPISQRKCQEYARLVYAGEDGKTEKCTIKNENLRPGRASYAEFPHMASLTYDNFTNNITVTEHACGGTLISEKFVLTAGVCVYRMEIWFKLRLKHVVLGAIKLNDSNRQIIPAAQLIYHPDFKGWSFFLSHFEIALVKLMWAPVLSPELRPACLPHDDENFSGRELILTGWGRSSLSGPKVSNELLKAVLFEVPHGKCEDLLEIRVRRRLKVHNASMFCAGHPTKRSSFSKADVGGPLQIVSSDTYCTYTIVGIPFYAPPPEFTGTPSVYTRIQHYRRWIENIVWN